MPAGPGIGPVSGASFPLVPRLPGVLSGPGSAAPAGVPPALASLAGGSASTNSDSGVQLNFRDAPLDQLLNMYGDLTGRTVIKGPLINAIITVRSQSPLTVPEAIQALESVLQLNGIALVQMGAKFVKVTKSELGRMESLALKRGSKDNSPAETDQLVSYIFTLKYIETEEVVSALQNVLHTYGKIQVLERANSVMLTDTSANLQRAQEVLEFMDVPPEARVETKIYELENGDAMAIAAQLQSIVDDAQGKTAQQRPRQAGVAMPIPMVTPQGAPRVPAVGGGPTSRNPAKTRCPVNTRSMAAMSPVLPLPGGGATRFQPVYVGDVAAAVAACLADPATAGRTYELGGYQGLFHEGRLIAMAGERMHPPGFTEVSAVCTRAEFRGMGLAARLVRSVSAGIVERGDVPMLHASAANTGAIALYERLGFTIRRPITFAVHRVPGAAPRPDSA